MPPIFYLATPVPLAAMIVAVVVLRLVRRASALKWLLLCWVAVTAFGCWWFIQDAARASAGGAFIVDAGYVNSFNCAFVAAVGLVIGLIAWLSLKFKIKPKGQQ